MSKPLNLVEVFWTFQGEGENAGRRALFIRLPFCNLKCSWCDTSFNHYDKWSEEDLINFMRAEPTRFAVVTGGEPMMNKQTPRVVELLKNEGFEVATETNGTFPIVSGIDFVCVSPKRDSNFEVHADALFKANEIKLVVDSDFDFSVAKRIQDLPFSNLVALKLSPEWNDFKNNIAKIENFIKENPRWRVSLQTHKFMGVK